jgi:hypothetical protein
VDADDDVMHEGVKHFQRNGWNFPPRVMEKARQALNAGLIDKPGRPWVAGFLACFGEMSR